MIVLVRASMLIWPREESAPALFSTVGWSSPPSRRRSACVIVHRGRRRAPSPPAACGDRSPPALEVGELGDADDVVLERHSRGRWSSGSARAPVPGHLVQLQGDLAAHPGVHHDVQAGDVGEQPEDVLQVPVLEVQADRRAEIAGRDRRPGRSLSSRARRQVRRRRRGLGLGQRWQRQGLQATGTAVAADRRRVRLERLRGAQGGEGRVGRRLAGRPPRRRRCGCRRSRRRSGRAPSRSGRPRGEPPSATRR